MTGKSALPRHKDFQKAFPAAEIIIGLVKDAVSEPGSYDCCNQQCIEQRVKKFKGQFFSLEEPLEEVPAEYESGNKQESVPSDLQTTHPQQDGIYVPIDK